MESNVIELDGTPKEVEESRECARNAIHLYFKRNLRGNVITSLPVNAIEELYQRADHALLNGGDQITAAIISGLKFFLSRAKPTWSFPCSTVKRLKKECVSSVSRYGGRPHDLNAKFEKLFELSFDDAPQGPILLHGDSMFLKAKVTANLLPIAHSGETAEDLLRLVQLIKVSGPRAVILNHGLNHTRKPGNPQPAMAQVLSLLQRYYPGVPIFHLETPTSPAISVNPAQLGRAAGFNQMMVDLGFIQIPHPLLGHRKGEYYAAGDDFHYSKKGLDEVLHYLVEYINSWISDHL